MKCVPNHIAPSLFFYVKLNIDKPQLGEKTKRDIIQELKNDKGVDVVPSVFPRLLLEKKFVEKEDIWFYSSGSLSSEMGTY